jgi:hypothetical protein
MPREEHKLSVSEKVQRRIFGPKEEEFAGGWRRPHNEELHSLYATLNIIRVTESRRIRWAGHVASMEEMMCIKCWSENLKGQY